MRVLPLLIILSLPLHGLQTRATEPSSKQKDDSEITQHKQTNKSEDMQQGIGANDPPAHAEQCPCQQQYDPYSDKLYRRYLGATILGSIVAGLGIAVLFIQTIATKRAAKAALLNARAIINAERPWMLFHVQTGSHISFNKGEEPPGDPWFTVIFNNWGQTPAEIVGFVHHLDCCESVQDLRVPPEYGVNDKINTHTRMIPHDRTWSPPEFLAAPSHQLRLKSIFSEEKWEALKKRDRVFIYWGILKYRDLIEDPRTIHTLEKVGTIHETRFCYMWHPLTNEFLICGAAPYNQHT
jgi:hypothetical protein